MEEPKKRRIGKLIISPTWQETLAWEQHLADTRRREQERRLLANLGYVDSGGRYFSGVNMEYHPLAPINCATWEVIPPGTRICYDCDPVTIDTGRYVLLRRSFSGEMYFADFRHTPDVRRLGARDGVRILHHQSSLPTELRVHGGILLPGTWLEYPDRTRGHPCLIFDWRVDRWRMFFV